MCFEYGVGCRVYESYLVIGFVLVISPGWSDKEALSMVGEWRELVAEPTKLWSNSEGTRRQVSCMCIYTRQVYIHIYTWEAVGMSCEALSEALWLGAADGADLGG